MLSGFKFQQHLLHVKQLVCEHTNFLLRLVGLGGACVLGKTMVPYMRLHANTHVNVLIVICLGFSFQEKWFKLLF